MRPLKNEPASCERVLYVFYDFETTQDTRLNDKSSVHVPNLVCSQQFCSKCVRITDIDQDWIQKGKRKHTFWDDTVVDMLSVRIPTLGREDNRDRSKREGLHPSLYSK